MHNSDLNLNSLMTSMQLESIDPEQYPCNVADLTKDLSVLRSRTLTGVAKYDLGSPNNFKYLSYWA